VNGDLKRGLKMKNRIGQKGSAIAVALVIFASVIVFEGVIVTNFIKDKQIIQRTARELAVINAVNTIEFTKKALQQAVSYSFYKSSYDVLARGGFCAYDENPCEEDCKILNDVPTLDCEPWWRVYGSTHAPSTDSFTSYLGNRTSAIYDDYASLFYGPAYCPRPPGKVTLEDTGTYSVRVDVTNVEGDVIQYKSENIDIVEHTVNFSDAVEITTFEVFALGKKKFVDEDSVKNAFDTANNEMENSCEDMEVSCGIPKEPDCVEEDPDGIKCKYENKNTCKYMWFDGVCENDMPGCDEYLGRYCCREDDLRCDFNDDERVDADERYNCSVLEKLEELEGTDIGIDPLSYLGLTVDTARDTGNCIKVGHKSDRDDDGTRISCDWEEIINVNDPCCIRVRDEKCCGCANKCTDDEDCDKDPDCTSDGKCPPSSDYACPSDGCGYWTCDDGCSDYECEGTATSCSAEELQEEGPCMAQTGCEWSEFTEECTGDATPCEDFSKSGCPLQDGCSWECVEMECEFKWHCRANVCGYECCKKTVAVVEDVSCTFEYFGTANVTVDVFDEENRYPIYDWDKLNLPFYVVSGNAEECQDMGPNQETSICCPAVTTDDIECKTGS